MSGGAARDTPIVTVEIRREQDVVLARQRARQVAVGLGYAPPEQTRIATAVSELARNAFRYAGGGRVDFALSQRRLVARVKDQGPGIENLEEILSGAYVSRTGMGIGLVGARRLADRFDLQTGAGGTTITFEKDLPPGAAADGRTLAAIAAELGRGAANDPLSELTQQNQELLRTMEELRLRQEELERLNQELEDTNRGVVALYAELDEKADYLRRASELKSRFLSNMSHEFRTPLNTVISFCRLLLDETDGPVNDEQRRQLLFARRAAEGMLELVNDLLDLAKVEAGKTTVRPSDFDVIELFGALRGMLKPLLVTTHVQLVFDPPEGLPTLHTDESKVSQVLRNFISNALKFTERGEVRVSARAVDDRVIFSVSDTGIGIAPEHLERIFEEYAQIDSPLQRRVKGTGLGLPLSRRLAHLLGGRIRVRSEPGVGSTFELEVPTVYAGGREVADVPEVSRALDPTRFPVLVVEDNPETVFVYDKFLKGTPFQVIPAATLAEARRGVATAQPVAIVLDLMLGNESAWAFLSELKSSGFTRGIPVFVVTMVDNRHKARALGADDYAEKPVDRAWLVERLAAAAARIPRERVLVADDDPAARYLLRGLLGETRYEPLEVSGGRDALRAAREEAPAAIFLDLSMPDLSGEEVLAALRSDPVTCAIPVIVYTSKVLQQTERDWLAARAVAVLSKETASRAAALAEVRQALARATPSRPLQPPAAELPP